VRGVVLRGAWCVVRGRGAEGLFAGEWPRAASATTGSWATRRRRRVGGGLDDSDRRRYSNEGVGRRRGQRGSEAAQTSEYAHSNSRRGLVFASRPLPCPRSLWLPRPPPTGRRSMPRFGAPCVLDLTQTKREPSAPPLTCLRRLRHDTRDVVRTHSAVVSCLNPPAEPSMPPTWNLVGQTDIVWPHRQAPASIADS
jgi:hypothetical protein